MTENNIEYYRNQIVLARTEIKNLRYFPQYFFFVNPHLFNFCVQFSDYFRQQLSALKHEHIKEIKLIKSALNELRCANCSETGKIDGIEYILHRNPNLYK